MERDQEKMWVLLLDVSMYPFSEHAILSPLPSLHPGISRWGLLPPPEVLARDGMGHSALGLREKYFLFFI